ncbi:uncharacterized protein LOC114251711 isoform X1 [Bombyx mandarina]|uniref:Uncharacterized protein LOC114251711 isoform X1 n=1 Tax=Bombyx mandarina TaxID=7092 RepID=A0A6J2KHQ7_BOMMA|nr:uncharacterized protein LOC114251711 isoform X1 [Bombyx mandarina]
MYKTVRHGENSLQYTILPQTEEVLNNSGLKGKGRDYSPSIHIRRSRRKSTVKYVFLVIFGVIIALGLAAVPLYILNGALYARRTQQEHRDMVTISPNAPAGREMAKSRKKDLKVLPQVISTLMAKPELDTSTIVSTTSSTGAGERATTPPWTMPALRSWKSSTSSSTVLPVASAKHDPTQPAATTSSDISMLPNTISMKTWEKDIIIRPTITAEPFTLSNLVRDYTQTFKPTEKQSTQSVKMFDDVLISTKTTLMRSPVTSEFPATTEISSLDDLKDTMLSVDDDEEFKESLEVDEVFSLPPLKPGADPAASNSDEITVSKANEDNWYGARWPFVDPSSYFQWTSYSPGDNLLLPLLMAALTSLTLVMLLALAAKRRKRTNVASSQIGKLTADLQDVNTNLLTAEVVEDAEE